MSVENTHKIDNSSFCQFCGSFLPAGSICPDCNIETTTIKKPLKILPFCGGDKEDDLSDIRMRACCRCGQEWMTGYDNWIQGTCPHCGASGSNGAKPHEIQTPITTKQIAQYYDYEEVIKNKEDIKFLKVNDNSEYIYEKLITEYHYNNQSKPIK